MLIKENHVDTQKKITEEFEKLSKEYDEKFIAERTGFYMLKFMMYAHEDDNDTYNVGAALRFIRTGLLSFFNRPGTLNDFNLHLNENELHNHLPIVKKGVHALLETFIFEMSNELESDISITRKDIDFLLDVKAIL